MTTHDFNFPVNIQTARHEDDVHSVLAQIERRILPAAPIAFYGSSSFRLWNSMATDLNCLDAVNLGFGGGTNASGSHYIDTLLTPLRPQKVVLYFGENDISADGLSANSTFENFKSLVAQIEDRLPSIPIFVLSAKQSPTKWIYANVVTQFNQLVKDQCGNVENLTFVNVTDTLLGEHGRPMSGLYVDDGVHLSPAGYAKWAKVLRNIPDLIPQT